MARSHRLRRKDLKQPDTYISLTAHAVAWVRANQQIATGVAVAAVAAVVLASGVSIYRSSQRSQANDDLAAAFRALETGKPDVAGRQFADAASRWQGTTLGDVARVLAADSLLRQSDAEKALVQLKELEAQAGSLPAYLQQQVVFSLGAALEAKGDLKAAAEKYGSAAQMPGPYAGPALLAQAEALDHSGAIDQARPLYRRYAQQFPTGPGREIAQARGGKADAKAN